MSTSMMESHISRRYPQDTIDKRNSQHSFAPPAHDAPRPASVHEDSHSTHSASSFHSQSHSQHSGVTNATASEQNDHDLDTPGYDSLEDRFPFLKDDRKRTRKLLTPGQTRVLEAIWERTIYPSTSLREAVACQLGIGPRKVQIWFQNKRQGRRRHVRSPEGGQFVAFTGSADAQHHRAASTAIYRPRDAASQARNPAAQSSRDQCIEMQAAADDLRLAELRDEHGHPFAELDLDVPAAHYSTLDAQQVQKRHYVAQPYTAQQQRQPQQYYSSYQHVQSDGQRQREAQAAAVGAWPRPGAPTIMYSAAAEPSSLMHRRMQSNSRQVEQLQYLITPRTAPPPMQRAVTSQDVQMSSATVRPHPPSSQLRPFYPIASPSIGASPRSADPTGWRSFCASHASISGTSPKQVGFPPPSPSGAQSRGRDKQMIMLPPLTPLTASPGRHSAAATFERLPSTPTRAPPASPAKREMLPSISQLVSPRR